MVYRRDAIDRLHAPTPHQLDLWRITRRPLAHADLREMVDLLIEAARRTSDANAASIAESAPLVIRITPEPMNSA